MNLFSKSPKRFVSEKAFEKNVEQQMSWTPQTLEQLRKYGASPEKELKLEFFFYTNTADKAAALAGDLLKRGYEVKHGPSASDPKIQVITGWTTRMPMSDGAVLDWTKDMCTVGYAHDCDFDGWGTNPKQ